MITPDSTILLLDIDQTLAEAVVAMHLTYYNQEFRLGLYEKYIQEADKNYGKAFDIPEIKKFRSINEENERLFQSARNFVRTSTDMHLRLKAFRNAPKKIHELLDLGLLFGGYYTVRTQEVYQATVEWLKMHKYPSPDNVILCINNEDKIKRIFEDWFYNNQTKIKRVVLIDDSIQELFDAITFYFNKNPQSLDVLKKLSIVGFGHNAELEKMRLKFHRTFGMEIFFLSSWNKKEFDRLVIDLRQL